MTLEQILEHRRAVRKYDKGMELDPEEGQRVHQVGHVGSDKF